MHACMYVCIYVCMYVCMYTHSHARTHTCQQAINSSQKMEDEVDQLRLQLRQVLHALKEHILSQENAFYYKRTHELREHTAASSTASVSTYAKRTHSITRKHIK